MCRRSEKNKNKTINPKLFFGLCGEAPFKLWLYYIPKLKQFKMDNQIVKEWRSKNDIIKKP